MKPYNEKRAMNVYISFYIVFVTMLLLCMCSCSPTHIPMQTNPKYIYTK